MNRQLLISTNNQPLRGATIKIMSNAETVNNVLASLYEALSDEAREMMLEVFREEEGE